MNAHRRAAFGLVVISACVLALTLVTRDLDFGDGPAAAPGPADADAGAGRRGATRPVAAPERRTHLPRPSPDGVEPAVAVSEGGAGEEQIVDDEDSGVLDDQGHLDPLRAPTPDNIRAAVQEVLPEVRACVDAWVPQWLAQDPDADGTLRVEITLGPEGIRDAAVLDVVDMPAGVATCFGAVIYDVAWPRPEDELTISYPFRVTAD